MIRCASVSLYMGPYVSNYIQSELALDSKFQSAGIRYIHIFPKDVQTFEWVDLFRQRGSVLYFIKRNLRSVESIKSLRSIFKKEDINLIYVHFGGWDIDARLAAPFTPTIWHQRMSVNLDTPKRRFYHNLMYKIIGRFKTHHVAISESVYNAITSLTNNKTYFIPDGIDFNRLKIKKELYASKSPDNPIRILLFAFSAIGKGLDIAMQACEKLNKQGRLVELLVVTQEDSNNYLQNNYLEMPSWLTILPPTSDVFQYYNMADIFLSASRSEGFCNALLEAIYTGLPCIYSDIPGTRWAGQFDNTFMYEVESPKSLADAIIICAAITMTIETHEKNRKLAQSKYSMNTWVEQVYNAILESGKM